MDKLIQRARDLIAEGVYDPNDLFNLIYPNSRKHYSTVRTAIHLAKTGLVNGN